MSRFFITGTDTDVGKTRVAAALAQALRGDPSAGTATVTVVKLVQTGIFAGEPGDAQLAGALSGCTARELRRFEKAADPWSAALAAGRDVPLAHDLAAALRAMPGALVVEGSGGAAVPLNATESISDVARAAKLEAIVVVGLRLGCISHALLTLEYLGRRGIPIAGAVLSERWAPADPAHAGEVERALRSSCTMLGTMPFENDAAACVERAVPIFRSLRKS